MVQIPIPRAAAEPRPRELEPGSQPRPAHPEFPLEFRVSRAEGARNATTGLVATTVAILTFALFFLYPMTRAGEISPVLFQVSIGLVLVTMFTLTMASVFYNRMMADLIRGARTPPTIPVASNLLLGVGLSLLTLFPSFVLYAIGQTELAVLALGLWCVLQGLVAASWGSFAHLD